MTLKELMDYISDENIIECGWRNDNLYLWIETNGFENTSLPRFTEMLSSYQDFIDIPCTLQSDGVVCVDLAPICRYYTIDPEQVAPRT